MTTELLNRLPHIEPILLDLLRIDGGTQVRMAIDQELVDEYAASMCAGDVFPPIVAFDDGLDYWIVDGFHRYHAARANGLDKFPVDLRSGTKRDAVLYAVGANYRHGLRRSNADKRRAVRWLLEDEEWGKWSNSQIARHCNVSAMFVGKLRRGLTVNVYSEEPTQRTYKTKHGTVATMDTTNIGQRDQVGQVEQADQADQAQVTQPPKEPDESSPSTAQLLISSKNNEWYTPSKIIELAREVMGGIDLDPASCEAANEIVKADTFYTEEMDGLSQKWYGRVWMNPPYGMDANHKSNAGKWSAHLIEAYEQEVIDQGFTCLNAAIGRVWFNRLWDYPLCFPYARIKFWNPTHKKDQPTFGNVLVYLGPKVEVFEATFSEVGRVILPSKNTRITTP